MGLKARVAEHNAGLAELLQEEHREKEGVVSSGHEQMDNLSAVAYVLDEPDIGSITAATGHDVDFEAVSAKLEARLAANATPPSEQEEALVPAPPVEAPPPSPPLPEATPQPLEAEESSEEITSGEGKPPQAPRVVGPPPSGKANFSSVRSNVAVFRGRWMYEVQLGSSGILQIGWTPPNARFTLEEGIGDSTHSYAYDGKRQRKWNVTAAPYGDRWTAGDYITCGIDMDAGTISYWRNGKALGIAFSNIRRRMPNGAYLAGISLSYAERCEVNFGDRPFMYPQEGYTPLQAPPAAGVLGQAEYIGDCWSRLLSVTAKHHVGPDSPRSAAALAAARAVSPSFGAAAGGGGGGGVPAGDDEEMAGDNDDSAPAAGPVLPFSLDSGKKEAQISAETAVDAAMHAVEGLGPPQAALPSSDAVLLAAALAPHTGPLCRSPYMVDAVLLPLLLSAMEREKEGDAALDRLLSLLCAVLEPEELQSLVKLTGAGLGRAIKGCIWNLGAMQNSAAYRSLKLWVRCLSHARWATTWTSLPGWLKQLESFLTVRQPAACDLAGMLPNLEWKEKDDFATVLAGSTKEGRFASDVAALAAGVQELEKYHASLLGALCCVPANRGTSIDLCHDLVAAEFTGNMATPPPALKTFLNWLAKKNAGAIRNVPPPGLSPGSVLASTFFGMLRLTRPWLQHLHKDGAAFDFYALPFLRGAGGGLGEDIPRFGGTLSHLLKEHFIDPTNAGMKIKVPAMAPCTTSTIPWTPGVMELPVNFTHSPEDPASGVGVELAAETTTAFGPLWQPHHGSGGGSRAGAEGDEVTAMAEDASTASRAASAANSRASSPPKAEEAGPSSILPWDWWLLDHLINLYSLGVASRVRYCFTHLNTLEQALNSLHHMSDRMGSERNAGGRELLRLSIAECKKTVEDSLRQHAWHSTWLTPQWKQEATLGVATVMARVVLEVAGREGPLLSYVQEPYLEAILEMLHAARRSENRAWPSAAELDASGMGTVISSVITLCDDPRIVSPDAGGMLLQTLWALLSEEECLGPMAGNPTAQSHLLPALIHLLKDQRNWVQAANALGLLVHNTGFGHMIKQPLPTDATEEAWTKAEAIGAEAEKHRAAMRGWLAPALRGDVELSSLFFNALFDNINWTVTELVVVLEELSAMSAGDQRGASHLQRRGAATAELCMLLLRLQELACTVIPEQILGRGKGLNATRLAEILAFGIRQWAPKGKLDLILQRKGLRPTRNRPAQDRRLRTTFGLELLSAYLGAIKALYLVDDEERIAALPAEPPLAHKSIVHALAQQSFPPELLETAFDEVNSHIHCDLVTATAMATAANGGQWDNRCPLHRYEMFEDPPMESQEVFIEIGEALQAAQEGAHGDEGGAGADGEGGDVADHEPPAEFLDPIMQTIMEDPVVLPNSGITVDRSTIERHLLSSATDPFSRAPLKAEELQPDEALRTRIEAWNAGDRTPTTMGTIEEAPGPSAVPAAAAAVAQPLPSPAVAVAVAAPSPSPSTGSMPPPVFVPAAVVHYSPAVALIAGPAAGHAEDAAMETGEAMQEEEEEEVAPMEMDD